MIWRLLPPDIAGFLNFGKARFVMVEGHQKGRKEAERLLMSQNIPIKTTGWHTGTRRVPALDNPAEPGAPVQGETARSQELRQQYADQSKEIADEHTPDGPSASVKDVGVAVVIFYTKKTQAYYARIALQADKFKLLEIPRASQSTSSKAANAYDFKPVTKPRKKKKRRVRPGRL
jgi:hypothetical protein